MNSGSPLDDLFHALAAHGTPNKNAMGVIAVLMTETLRYRDRLRVEEGYVLTVEDTRLALDALEQHLNGHPEPPDLTPEQSGLANILISRLTAYS